MCKYKFFIWSTEQILRENIEKMPKDTASATSSDAAGRVDFL